MPRPVSAQTALEQRMADRATFQAPNAKDPLDKLRLLCLSRGAVGILGFGKMFRRMDDDGSGCLSFSEFKKGKIMTLSPN